MAENMLENLAGNIPHAGPMRWIHAAFAQKDNSISAQQYVPADHPFLIHGRLPRSTIIEYIAQTAAAGGTALAAENPTGQAVSGMLIALRDVRFYSSAGAGDTLSLRVAVTHRMGNMFRCRGQAHCGATLICEGWFSFCIHSGK